MTRDEFIKLVTQTVCDTVLKYYRAEAEMPKGLAIVLDDQLTLFSVKAGSAKYWSQVQCDDDIVMFTEWDVWFPKENFAKVNSFLENTRRSGNLDGAPEWSDFVQGLRGASVELALEPDTYLVVGVTDPSEQSERLEGESIRFLNGHDWYDRWCAVMC